MFALKLEKTEESKIRAIVFDVDGERNSAHIADIVETEENNMWVLVDDIGSQYPDLNAVYLGNSEANRQHPGITLLGDFAVLVPDACDVWTLAEAELRN